MAARAIVLAMVSAQVAVASGKPAARRVDAILAGLRADRAPGAAVLVLKNGKPVFERGYGLADLRTRRNINVRTNFRLASVTKQFTAAAIMLLVRDGKLRYDERLTDVFPDFPEYGRAITIRHLLNHTSGLLDYEDLMEAPPQRGELRQIQDDEVLALLKKQTTTKFPPGSSWSYSNSGYVLLGVIVGRVSGESFGDFLRDRIFVPLGMTHTVLYRRGINEVSDRAYGHACSHGSCREDDQSATSATQGDGGVYSSLEDLAKWDAALREHKLLREAEMQPALTPVQVPDHSVRGPAGESEEYGFGWFLSPYKGHPRMWHYGETEGFRTTIQRFPKDGLTIIILANRDDLTPSDLALRVADLYLTP